MRKSKVITLILSLSMIVAVSMSTIALAEGSGENWQGREYYKTHYISTNALVKDNSENAPSRFFLQADMPIELTLLGQDSSLEPNQLQSIRIKGASSSARNMPQGTVIYGDMYEGYNHITSIENYSINSNLAQNSLAIVINAHLKDTTNIYNMTSSLLSIDNYGATEHSVFTTGYGVIRGNIPVFDTNGELTTYTTTGMIDYFSQYTYFSENPYIPYTCFTVGTQPLDLSSDIYYKECYYYGFGNNYGTYYMVDGNQIGAFRVYCWSNSSEDLTDNNLTSGFYLLMPSSIPSIMVTKEMTNYIGTSIHLSYTSALGTQLDNVSQSWYNTGYTDGNIFGYNQGYNAGYDSGVDIGYDNGLSDGRLEQTFTFERLIFTVLETPVKIILSTFDNVTILGTDIKVALISILTLTLILFVVRFVSSLLQANTSIDNANSPISRNRNLSRDINNKKIPYNSKRELSNSKHIPNKRLDKKLRG